MTPSKSKKRLFDPPVSNSQTGNPNSSEKTPENTLTSSTLPPSVKEARRIAASRRRSEDPMDNVSSARRQLVFSPNDYSSSDQIKLPEKYEALGKLFDALDSSILLSKLRGSKPTFSIISQKIEHLTERRFCYSHLAQIKHILPEAIEIKKVLVHDEATSCMKPDLHVTLNADAVEESKNNKILLRKVFRRRLADFAKAHPQGDEVPEEQLPELFSRRKPNEDSKYDVKSFCSLMEEMANIPAAKLISSFMKSPVKPEINMEPSSSPAKINLAPTPATVLPTPAKIESTPVILASTPPELASTPAQLFDDIDPDDVPTDPAVKLARRSSRSLNFDSYAEDKNGSDEEFDQVPEEDELLMILSKELRQSIKEHERKAIEESNPAISQAKRRRKMIACLPKLFNVIHYLIQSIRRWVITKEELVHKIISGHSDITDRKEVEAQLMLMQELVPEWISEKRSSSGDLLVIINKLASPQTIRSHLEEENKKAVALSCC